MTTLALFGATGGVGRRLVERARLHGVALRVLVRDRNRLPSGFTGTVTVGDARDRRAVAEAIAGADAVLSCLGMQDISVPATDLSDSVRTIVATMEAAGPRRFVGVAALGLLPHPDGGFRADHGLPAFLANVAREHRRMYETLTASTLNWTLLCPGFLDEQETPGTFDTAIEDAPAGGMRTGRADLAEAMLGALDDATTLRKRVGLISRAGSAS